MSDNGKNFGMMTRALHSGWKNDPATGASGAAGLYHLRIPV